MSSSKFIHVGKSAYLHVYDVLHDVFVKHLVDAAVCTPGELPTGLAEEVDSWRVCATVGDVSVSFDEDWTEDQRHLIAGLAEKACTLLSARRAIPATEMRSWDLLDGNGVFARGEAEIPTAPVVEVGRAVITLLRGGTIDSPPNGTWFYTSSGRKVWPLRHS